MSKIVGATMSTISVVVAIAMALVLVAQYIMPSTGSILPMMGVAAPAIYIINICMALYWILGWRWREAALMIVVVAIASTKASLFIKVPMTKRYDNVDLRATVKVMTFNIKGAKDDAEGEMSQYIESINPSILAIQEMGDEEIAFEGAMARYNRAQKGDLAIVSRYPIIRSEESDEELNRGWVVSMWADIKVGKDTIRVFNNHLRSTTITARENEYLTSTKIVKDTNRGSAIGDIFRRHLESCIGRAKEADKIAQVIGESPYRVIVCGDFNDTPASYTYATMARGLVDSFVECGEDYSYTYRGFFNSLRIDYILLSPEMRAMRYEVDNQVKLSDHLPVMVRVKL